MSAHQISTITCIAVLTIFCSFHAKSFSDNNTEALLDMELEQLLGIQITSASKKPQSIQDTASAVSILTYKDIVKSGVTNIPDALRMIPGLQVARVDANKWAISSRGFNSNFSNKLLVLIDGRSVYSPTFSGVYWDAQDVLFEDIDRIEVIRGSGAAIWGANAVNGVINIITKNAQETIGSHLSVLAGNEESANINLRYGAKINENVAGRVYLKYKEVDGGYSSDTGANAGDNWDSLRGGFRLDLKDNNNELTFQGDIYRSDINSTIDRLWLNPAIPGNNVPYFRSNVDSIIDSKGHNLLLNWRNKKSEKHTFNMQVYYDHSERNELILGQHNDVYDVEFNHQVQFESGNEVIWGLNYRRIKDNFANSEQIAVQPNSVTIELYSVFAQYEIDVSLNTKLTLGAKLEDTFFTNLEFQPNIRMIYKPDERQSFWGAISKAVRTPSRTEENGLLLSNVIPTQPPIPLYVNGNTNLKSEDLRSFELGYRLQASENLSYDISAFYNRYKNLASIETVEFLDLGESQIPLGFQFGNQIRANSIGFEAASIWRVNEWWKLQINYSYLNISSAPEAQSTDMLANLLYEGASPNHQLAVTSNINIDDKWSLYFAGIYVDELTNTNILPDSQKIDGYFDVNFGMKWQLLENVEVALFGQNLLDKKRLEFVAEEYNIPSYIERSLFIRIRNSF